MKFEKGTRRRALEYEKDLMAYWKTHNTFEKSVQQRPADNQYVFYDGPPFITGIPHTGTLLSSIAKDVVPRFWTMQGKRVERRWGWDCHGLPAEVFTEKKLGIHDRRDIGTKISLEQYILTCRENMVQTGNLWEDTIDRIGRWVDFAGAYRTMDKDFMESVWWAFKQLYDKGRIYEGERVLLYCTRDATPISKAEVAMDNSYQDVTDPSVFVKFKLKNKTADDGQPVYLLAWTTTPWTLNANTAIGVGEDETYAQVRLEDGTELILLANLVDKVLTDEKHQAVAHTVVRGDIAGSELVGMEYEPLLGTHRGENAHKVWNYPGLSTEEGSGIVHLAPAYGEEDYALSKQLGFPFVIDIDDSGFYTEGPWQGQNVWEANKPIAKELHGQGVVWKIDYIKHSYPHCHRCGTKLMYRAHPSWFMDIDGNKQLMLEQNENVNWFPAHLKHGRFQKTVESAPDWNLSRDRFWATAMPVWKGVDADGGTTDADGRPYIKVVGSYSELKDLSGEELADYHRPWVDDITFDVDGVHYTRIDKVMDCWFESGSMPFAQFHYPFENVEKFEQNFPGDYIVEYVGQVRAWFYYVHAVNTALFGKNAFKNVITTGVVAGNDGRKMSKSLGNFTDPNELMDKYSADSLRMVLMSSSLMNGEDFALQDKDVADVARKLSMVWNMYDFFTLYASVDGWDSPAENAGLYDDPLLPSANGRELSNPLDRWIVSRLHQLTAEIEQNMCSYDVSNAVKGILPFLDDASNWYVRRSRRRFWKSEDDGDKQEAYRTLHYVLTRVSLLLAPFAPFMAEELYRKLTGGESVHLRDWPATGTVDQQVLAEMTALRAVINEQLGARAAAKIKTRQPLARLTFKTLNPFRPEFLDILCEELNVKAIENLQGTATDVFGDANVEWTAPQTVLDMDITTELLCEGQMREIVRYVQNSRKQAGLDVADRIRLHLDTHDEALRRAIDTYGAVIAAETLADSLTTAGSEPAEGHSETVRIDGAELAISLARAV